MSEHAASAAPRPIRFGTSGWRGVAGDDFTSRRMAAAVHAAGRWFAEAVPGAAILVAHDTRFAGARLAERAACILSGQGLAPRRARGPSPTPLLSRALRRGDAAGGLMFTASHNPPSYLGLKVFGPTGGGVPSDETARIEEWAAEILATGQPVPLGGSGREVDLRPAYQKDLLARLDVEAMAASDLQVFYDAMHGAGAGVLDTLLRRAGLSVETRRSERNLRFGGGSPDPLPRRLVDLVRTVRGGGRRCLGLATDGDADRYAVLDAGGRFLSATQAVALMVDHLASAGRISKGVAISTATGTLVDRVAATHGLSVTRHPIGFKYLSAAMDSGQADVAGEESGGFALADFNRDKDGILAGSLLAEMAARDGSPLAGRVRQLERRLGASACGRTALAGGPEALEALVRMAECPPERIDGRAVRAVDARDGLRLSLDDGFLMVRCSGTEQLVRIYAEAPSARELSRRLDEGVRWVRRGVRGAWTAGPEPGNLVS